MIIEVEQTRQFAFFRVILTTVFYTNSLGEHTKESTGFDKIFALQDIKTVETRSLFYTQSKIHTWRLIKQSNSCE